MARWMDCLSLQQAVTDQHRMAPAGRTTLSSPVRSSPARTADPIRKTRAPQITPNYNSPPAHSLGHRVLSPANSDTGICCLTCRVYHTASSFSRNYTTVLPGTTKLRWSQFTDKKVMVQHHWYNPYTSSRYLQKISDIVILVTTPITQAPLQIHLCFK